MYKREAGVAAGQDEPVPAQPLRVGRIVPHHVLEQQVGQRRQAHRRARMPVAGPLDGIGRQHPDGVHRPHVEVGPPDRIGQGPGQQWVAEGCVAHSGCSSVDVGGRIVGAGVSVPDCLMPGRAHGRRVGEPGW